MYRPTETVQLLWFWQTSLCQSKSKIHFYKKQEINKSAGVIFGLVRLIVLSYNRKKKHIKECKIIGRSQGILLHIKLSNKQSGNVICRLVITL